MARKGQTRKARKNSMDDMAELHENTHEPQKRKKWSLHDIKTLKAMTESQRELIESYLYGNNIIASGSPGTGKTYLGLWLALQSVLSTDEPQDKIIIVRSIVTTGRDIGALPGELHEKIAPYEAPYKDAVIDLMGKQNSYQDMKDARKIEFIPTSFVRGMTWDNSIILLDECQNLSWQEILSVVTRTGKNSRLFICGDIGQNDLATKRGECSGFLELLKVGEKMPSVDTITFTKNDIVRSGVVKEFLIAKEDCGL